jgi:hypothetical protein
VKQWGYGLLNLKPDELFLLTLPELFDMVNAKVVQQYTDQDKEYERTAWFTSLLMSATGNYGKKGIDPKKLYKRQYDDMGRPLDTVDIRGVFNPVDRETKDNKLNELFAKFNK